MRDQVERIETGGGWQDLRDVLSGEVSVLPLGAAAIRNGSEEALERGEMYIGPMDEVSGSFLAFSPEMTQGLVESGFVDRLPVKLSQEDARNSFYLGHAEGAPWELKVDPEYSLQSSEEWHVHDGWELYSAWNGELQVGMLDGGEKVYKWASEDSMVFVPPYVSHRVVSEKGDPTHVVARYSDDKDRISRFDQHGNLDYGWGNDPEFEERAFSSYDEDIQTWLSKERNNTYYSDD